MKFKHPDFSMYRHAGVPLLQARLLCGILVFMNLKCHRCGKEVKVPDRVGRRDLCPSCGTDLRCCLHCLFHDPSRAGACREPQAERVLDKERSNFCDYFAVRKSAEADRKQEQEKSSREKLESLFRK